MIIIFQIQPKSVLKLGENTLACSIKNTINPFYFSEFNSDKELYNSDTSPKNLS